MDVLDILKSRVGVYEDTPHNRRLNRVGQHYGQEAQPDEASEKDRERAERLLKYTKALEEVQNKLKDPYLSSKAYESGKDLEAKLTDKIQKLRERMGGKAIEIAQQLIEARAQEAAKPKIPYEEKESSLRYTYDPEKVKFKIIKPFDLGGFTKKDLETKGNWYFGACIRRTSDGKFYLVDDLDWWESGEGTLGEFYEKALEEAKNGYRYNEGERDHIYQVGDVDYDSPYSIHIHTELIADNQVQISITRFKTEKDEPIPDKVLDRNKPEPNFDFIHDEDQRALVESIFKGEDIDFNKWDGLSQEEKFLMLEHAGFTGLVSDDDIDMGTLYYPERKERLLSVLEEAIVNENDPRYGMDDTQSWAVGYADGTIKRLSHEIDNDFEIETSDRQLPHTQYKLARKTIHESKVNWILYSDGYDQPKYWVKDSEALASLKEYGGFEAWFDGRGEKKRDYVQDDWI